MLSETGQTLASTCEFNLLSPTMLDCSLPPLPGACVCVKLRGERLMVSRRYARGERVAIYRAQLLVSTLCTRRVAARTRHCALHRGSLTVLDGRCNNLVVNYVNSTCFSRSPDAQPPGERDVSGKVCWNATCGDRGRLLPVNNVMPVNQSDHGFMTRSVQRPRWGFFTRMGLDFGTTLLGWCSRRNLSWDQAGC